MYDFSNQFNFDFSQQGAGPKYRPFSPEEEQSKLDEILAKSTGMLSWVAQAFDKFGRGVRGTANGLVDLAQGDTPNWGGGLLNWIPGSDTFGLTDPSKGVQGRDLLENLGAPKNIEGFHPIDHPGDALWDVASLATEIALDPLTYTGIGTLTKAGQAAKNAGKLTSNLAIAPGIRAGERNLLSFMGKGIISGDTAADFAGKFIDPVSDYLRFKNPVGRTLNRLFDPEVMEQSTEVGQKLAKEKYYPLLQQRLGAGLKPIYEQHEQLYKAGHLDDPNFVKLLRQEAEGLSTQDWRTLPKGSPEALAGEIGEQMRNAMKETLDAAQEVGLNTEQLTDSVVQYAARFHHEDGVVGAVKNLLNAIRPSNLFRSRARKEFLKDIQGGTEMINDIAAGLPIGPGGEHIWQMPVKEAGEAVAALYNTGKNGISPEEAFDRGRQLAGWMQAKNADDYLLKGKKIYNANALQDQAIYTSKAIKARTHAEMMLDLAARSAKPGTPGQLPEGAVSVLQTLHDIGVDRQVSTRIKPFAENGKTVDPKIFDPSPGAYKGAYRKFGENLAEQGKIGRGEIWDASEKAPWIKGEGKGSQFIHSELTDDEMDTLRKAGIDPSDIVRREKNQFGPMKPVGGTFKDMKNWYLERADYDNIVGMSKVWRTPEEISGIKAAHDALQNFWKASVTQVWPSFHGRNVLGGLYYHWVSGASKGPLGAITPFKAAYDALQGGEIDQQVLRSLGKTSTGDLLAEARSYGLLKAGTTAASEKASAVDNLMSGMQGHIPRAERSFKEGVKQGVGESVAAARSEGAERIGKIDPKAGRLKAGAQKAGIVADEVLGALMDMGRKTGNFTEDLMRLGHYVAQRSRGMTPHQASESVKKWFFDYAELTQFEQNVMRRVFPFYTWARKNTPLILQELIQHPGGKIAQSIRAVNEPREGGQYVPEWVGQGGVAIPTGKPGRYLTGLGLPFESALNWQLAPTMGKTVQRNLESTIASMAPPISGAYALASGRDPYSGRNIDEMKIPTTGNVLSDALIGMSQDPVLMRTPLSRAITTGRRIMDTRKGAFASGERAAITLADLLTGVKVTDVPGGPEVQKELEGRKALNEIMKTDPAAKRAINSHTRFYADPSIPKEMLPPSVTDYLRMQATLEKHARENSKKKRQETLTKQQELLITPK